MPLVVGIAILWFGIVYANKEVGYWECMNCGITYPRKLAFTETWVFKVFMVTGAIFLFIAIIAMKLMG